MWRSHDWRLPAVTVAAGALLALLAILLAWWSKGLLKEAARAECATRAGALALNVKQDLDQRLRALIQDGRRPPEAAAVYRLRSGAVVDRDPADAAPPPPLLLRAVALHDSTADLPIVLPGTAATYVPNGSEGRLVVWNLERVRRAIVAPHLEQDERYAAILLEPSQNDPDALALRVRAHQTLYPPLTGWRVGVGLTDPSGVRRNLRFQTALLGLLATWLLLALAGSVWLITRRERARTEHQRKREQFLTRAYHELQTPLALMRAAAESLQRGAVEKPEDLNRCVAIMTREEERLTRTIRRLLRYLRLESGPSAQGEELASLHDEVARTVDEARLALEAHGLRVELSLAGVDPAWQAPRDLVADTLHELFNNVRKYATDASAVTISLTTNGAARATLTVSDDGPGVPDPASVFTPWEREGNAGGSGLGLALLREGWEAAGGAIECDPTAAGARFVVTVPLQR